MDKVSKFKNVCLSFSYHLLQPVLFFPRSMDIDQSEVEWSWTSKCKIAKKRIIEHGTWEGTRPTEGAECKLVLEKLKGEWDSDFEFGKEILFTIGFGDTKHEGLLERCLATMDKNELSLVVLGNVRCTVRLLDFKPPEIPEHEFDQERAIQVATKHKDAGVKHYKKGNILGAYAQFRRAIRNIIFAGKDDEKVLPLYKAICNNIALCHLKLNRPELAIDVCNKVLSREENNVKALLRRASSYNLVRDYENAHLDLLRVLELEPNNPTANGMLPSLMADLHEMNARYKDMVKKMFVIA